LVNLKKQRKNNSGEIMKKILTLSLIILLFAGSFRQAKPITQRTCNFVTAGVAVGGGLLSGLGTYLVLKQAERNKDNPEWIFKNKVLLSFMAGLAGAGACGGLAWWQLSKYTPSGRLEKIKEDFKKLKKNGFFESDDNLVRALNASLTDNRADVILNRFVLKNSGISMEASVTARKKLKNLKHHLDIVLEEVEKAEEDGGTKGLENKKQEILNAKVWIDRLEDYIVGPAYENYMKDLSRYDEKRNPRVTDIKDKKSIREKRAIEAQKLGDVPVENTEASFKIDSVDSKGPVYKQ
jgi:hypothetical protein